MWQVTRQEVTLKNGKRTVVVKWGTYTHTANVFDESGREIDCFTFAWEKDEAASADFMDALNSWMADADTVEVW
jgi:hypothetical protein